MLVTLIIPILLVVLFFWKKNVKSLKFYSLIFQIPGPKTIPLLGNALEIKKKGVLTYFSQIHEELGPVCRFWLGSTVYVTLTDPEDIEVLLRDTKNLSKSQNYDFIKPWLGLGLVTSTGNRWHLHRKILTPAFHFKITERFVEVFNEKGSVLIKKLQAVADKGSFDIYPFMNLYALDAIIESAMGVKFDVQENEENEYVNAVHEFTDSVIKRSFSAFLRSDLVFPFTKTGRRQEEVLKVLHGFCREVIKERKTELKDHDEELVDDSGVKRRLAFLDLLLISQERDNSLTDYEIREEVDTFMFAGHDTTTSAMSFAIYHIANHPCIQNKLFEEIKQIFGTDFSREITLSDINSAKYLDLVVKESLRLTPPIPFISRTLDSDLYIKNYTIPAGASVSVFIFGVHRNPNVFPNPEKFDPDRFSLENSNRHPFAYVPFSAGPRNCIGQKYAQLEIKSTLLKILRKFEILPGEEIEELKNEMILKSTNGLRIRLKERK